MRKNMEIEESWDGKVGDQAAGRLGSKDEKNCAKARMV